MKLKCACGAEVGEGNIESIDIKGTKKRKLYLKEGLKGEVHRNKSSDPEKWTYLCSGCQKDKVKK